MGATWATLQPCPVFSVGDPVNSSSAELSVRCVNGKAVAVDSSSCRSKKSLHHSWLGCCNEIIDHDHQDMDLPATGLPTRMTAQQEQALVHNLDTLARELFRLHDLNMDGLLSEIELIKLNEKIAMLHYGKDADRGEVKRKYQELFRSKLSADGKPVPFEVFHRYLTELLNSLDPDIVAQEMILEQFVAEARSGRAAFRCQSMESVTDAPFLAKMEHAGSFRITEGSSRGVALNRSPMSPM